MREFFRRLFCFHNPDTLLVAYKTDYINGYGDVFDTTIHVCRCEKCGGVYRWFAPYGKITVRADLWSVDWDEKPSQIS